MRRAPLFALLTLMTLALAGCGDDGPEQSVEANGHVHGDIYTCPDGTKIDPGDFPDHHDPDFDPASKCPQSGKPASTTVSVGTTSATAFDEIQITWDVTPATGVTRTGNTQVRWSESAGNTARLTGPESFGTQIDGRTAQDVPATFKTTWVPDHGATYYIRSYAESEGSHVWSEPVRVEVQEVQPTGVEHTVTVRLGVPSATLDPVDLNIRLGDAVVWDNQDLLSHQFVSTDGPRDFDSGPIASMAQSEAIPLLAPGTYAYEDQNGNLAGTITVVK